MSFITDIVGGGVGNAIKSIGETVKSFIPNEVDKKEVDLKIQEEANRATEQVTTQAEDQLEALLKDTSDARNREIKVNNSQNASWLSKNTLGILALGVTLGFFGMLTFMCLHTIPKENETVLNIMLGSLGSAWIGITSYYFGSSAGSKTSGDSLRRIAEKV